MRVGGAWGAGEVWAQPAGQGRPRGGPLRCSLKGRVTGPRAGTGLEGAECVQRLEALCGLSGE